MFETMRYICKYLVVILCLFSFSLLHLILVFSVIETCLLITLNRFFFLFYLSKDAGRVQVLKLFYM